MKRRIKLLLALLAALLPAAAWALDYKSVSVPRAVLFDAPSAQAKKIYVMRQYTPVEVIVNLGDWVKVRDVGGDLAWIETASLGDQRTVQVNVDAAEVHAAPDANSRLLFRADRNVALELVEDAGGWTKVRHRDGMTGYVLSTEVWGR